MNQPHNFTKNELDKLTFGYEVSAANIPSELAPLVAQTIDIFKECHPQLSAVYLLGNVVREGGFSLGTSDLDVVGVTEGALDPDEENARQEKLFELGSRTQLVSFIDDNCEGTDNTESSLLHGPLFKVAVSGVSVWGTPVDYRGSLPSREVIADAHTARNIARLERYVSGDIVPAFKQNPLLLIRWFGKSALRSLIGITIRRGADFQMSYDAMGKDVDIYIKDSPEAITIKNLALRIIHSPEKYDFNAGANLAEQAGRLYYRLYPNIME